MLGSEPCRGWRGRSGCQPPEDAELDLSANRSGQDAPSPRRAVPAAATAGMLVLAAAMGIGRFAYTPLLPGLQEALGWTIAQAGDVASANFLGYLGGALAAAFLVNRPQRRVWLVLGMVLSVVTTGSGVWAGTLSHWLILRFLSGLASAFCLVLGTAVVVEALVRLRRPQLAALHFGGVGIGIVLSVLMVEVARLCGASVFGQWGALGGLSALLMGLAGWGLRDLPAGRANPGDSRRAPRIGSGIGRWGGPLARTIWAYGLYGFGYVVTATFIVAMARRVEHAELIEPLTWLMVGLLAAPSVLLWQWLAGRHGLFTALRAAYLVEAVGVLLAGFGTGQVALLLGGALLGATFMGIVALGLAGARQLAVTDQDRAMGWMTVAFGLGQLLGPGIAGRMAHISGGFELPSLLAAGLLLLGIGLLWGIQQK